MTLPCRNPRGTGASERCRLGGREGVDAGCTLPVSVEGFEKLSRGYGESDEVETTESWLISISLPSPARHSFYFIRN